VREHPSWCANGFLGLLAALILAALAVWAFTRLGAAGSAAFAVLGAVLALAAVVILASLTIVQPGYTAVVQFFGRYVGTARTTGLLWLPPLSTRRAVSVRVRNFETERLKVNDADGNPVEVAAIVVWQIADTAQAVFAVESVIDFVAVQSEAAVRHVARSYPYDGPDDVESLRRSTR
jgi:regulator of protease activity HflC (stomatin/prohibitin superfamily)